MPSRQKANVTTSGVMLRWVVQERREIKEGKEKTNIDKRVDPPTHFQFHPLRRAPYRNHRKRAKHGESCTVSDSANKR